MAIDPRLVPLPGGDLVQHGIDDLARGVESVPALLVSIGAERLRHAGLTVPGPVYSSPERRLYDRLASEDSDSAHSRYNALIRRLVSWACEHEDVQAAAERVRSGARPEGYPKTWPTAERWRLPPGTAPYSDGVKAAVEKQKAQLRERLADESLQHYGHDAVSAVLAHWKVAL